MRFSVVGLLSEILRRYDFPRLRPVFSTTPTNKRPICKLHQPPSVHQPSLDEYQVFSIATCQVVYLRRPMIPAFFVQKITHTDNSGKKKLWESSFMTNKHMYVSIYIYIYVCYISKMKKLYMSMQGNAYETNAHLHS